MKMYRERAREIARTQLGVKEHPPGTNSGPKVNEYLRSTGLGPGYPWCMAFVHWSYRKAGLILKFPNPASVGFFEQWARKNGYLVSSLPGANDIVCYRFDADNWPDHVGIVDSVNRVSRKIVVIEGNTGIGDDANGGQVMLRTRNWDSNCRFVRIPGGFQSKPIIPRTVDVYVDGELRLKRQNPANPLVLKRIGLWIKDKTVTVRRAK